jgi:hypothetical protein
VTPLLIFAGVSLGATAAMAWCLRRLDTPTPQRDPDHPSLRVEVALVDATDWPADKLDRLLADMGIVAQGCVDLTGQPPLTPDLVPVTDEEWRAAVSRVLDASGRDGGES